MNNEIKINEVKKSVLKNGGTFLKCGFYINGQDAYSVNGHTMTKGQMIERFKMGDL